MAKTLLSNLAAISQNTLADNIKMIDISELHDSEDNFFSMERIEELAETILGQGGVKDNLIVKPLETGGYEIISGHRRKAAVQYLLDRGDEISSYLPCLVQDYADNDDKMLDLILMNVSTRHLTDSEIWNAYEILSDIMQKKKSAHKQFGRVRELIAETLGVSASQVGKLQNIERHAAEPVVEALEAGDISISTANAIARLDEEEQLEIIANGPEEIKEKKPRAEKENSEAKVDTNVNFLGGDDGGEDEESDTEEEKDIAAYDPIKRIEKADMMFDTGMFNDIVCGFFLYAVQSLGLNADTVFAGVNFLTEWLDQKSAKDAREVYMKWLTDN